MQITEIGKVGVRSGHWEDQDCSFRHIKFGMFTEHPSRDGYMQLDFGKVPDERYNVMVISIRITGKAMRLGGDNQRSGYRQRNKVKWDED